jgi:hypothetical protein
MKIRNIYLCTEQQSVKAMELWNMPLSDVLSTQHHRFYCPMTVASAVNAMFTGYLAHECTRVEANYSHNKNSAADIELHHGMILVMTLNEARNIHSMGKTTASM